MTPDRSRRRSRAWKAPLLFCPPERLAELYPTRDDYLRRYAEAVDAAIAAGLVLPGPGATARLRPAGAGPAMTRTGGPDIAAYEKISYRPRP
ncbi:hypothetical protein MXD62_26960 [Frankia sp. Mgl5]|uniref:alpha/beta hydrolase domain-containing protein n=1 Tax=Frankia sp. Mgl5 TaxID=2933793 RepID=UPI002010947D|nr:alpha/beta hydrolase domain-containing protein [Frankia sp. Mgl5]MCK9930747.1 hypothetical protein [Frankia sp. Mgl5]